jgi:hypothetical protein
MTTPEMKPDAGILVASVRESDGAVKIESFPISENVLTPQEAVEQGLHIIKPTSTKKIGVWCGGIAERFKEYSIISSAKEITGMIKNAEKLEEKERKHIWVSILRELHKHTDEQLNAHYEAQSQEWRDWCNDAVLFYAYNAVIFKKGIPSMELTTADKARAR